MKKILSVLLTLVLALGLALPAVAEDAIKIGVIGPLTGPAAIYGTALMYRSGLFMLSGRWAMA